MPSAKQSTSERVLDVLSLGYRRYAEVWEMQKDLLEQRITGAIPDTLILVEHNHVYTLGRNADEHFLLADEENLAARGIELFRVERGGEVTYHGPGQVVGYPILALERHGHDLHKYLRSLEEVLIRTLADYGIDAGRDPEHTGVWVGEEKIAAIGIKVSRWVTMHGFAFNVNTDLDYFGGIIPCGILHKGVTSMAKLLGKEVALEEVEEIIVAHFASVFDLESASLCPPTRKSKRRVGAPR